MAAGTLLLVAHPATWPLAQTVLQGPPSPDLTYPLAWGCNGGVGNRLWRGGGNLPFQVVSGG